MLGASDYWMLLEWQHHCSPHVHGIAFVCRCSRHSKSSDLKWCVCERADLSHQQDCLYHQPSCSAWWIRHWKCSHTSATKLILMLWISVNICLTLWLLASVSHCSAAYCLHMRGGQLLSLPKTKQLQSDSELVTEDGDPQLFITINGVLVNSYNPV